MLNRTCKHCGSPFIVESKYSNRKFCSTECRFKDALPSSIDTDDCVSWTKSINKVTGYGQFNISLAPPAKIVSAHRMSYEIFNGPLESGELVRHKCDNRLCVNPRHLVKGTQADNISDMFERGRQQSYESVRGERHRSNKLKEKDVLEIRASSRPQIELARSYGVHPSTIHSIKSRKIWAYLPESLLAISEADGLK